MIEKKGKPASDIMAVGLSGGVDSSVAAYLLAGTWDHPGKGRGLVGASLMLWGEESNRHTEALKRAADVCDRIGIGFYAFPMKEEFQELVINDFIETYSAGMTPNPCVRCNRRIKFGLFYTGILGELRRRDVLGDGGRLFFSTGHYVRTEEIDGRWYFRKGADARKDQSYMLYRVDPGLLPFLLFPLGSYTKQEVVEIARGHGLPSASVRESQDVCFVDGDYSELVYASLRGAVTVPVGEIVDTSGRVLGGHPGYIRYTVGQRKGLGLGNGPLVRGPSRA